MTDCSNNFTVGFKRTFSAAFFGMDHPSSFEVSTATPVRIREVASKTGQDIKNDHLASIGPESSLFDFYESPMRLPEFEMPDPVIELTLMSRSPKLQKNHTKLIGSEQFFTNQLQ